MSEPRVKAALWVQMALRLGDLAGCPGMVLRRGDPDAGGVLVVLRGRGGLIVLSQITTSARDPSWIRGSGPEPVPQTAADAYIERQVRIDPDLWVIEFDSVDFTPPFEANVVS